VTPTLEKGISGFRTLDDVELAGKTVLVRCDFNVPINKETKEILGTYKIEAHKETLNELSDRGAKVVVLSHQSRPGKKEFISLETHSKTLSNILNREIKFVDDIFGEKALSAIKNLSEGEILVLENLRFHEEENVQGDPADRARTEMVQSLSCVADLYVCDAFACTHRAHPSMVGFPHIMPSVVARLMEKELLSIMTINGNPHPPMGYVLGGAKLEETFLIMENALRKGMGDYFLITGVPSLVFLKAKGYGIGKANEKFLAKNNYSEAHKTAAAILKGNEDKVYIPIDVAIEENHKRVDIDVDSLPSDYPIKDIGAKTAEEFSKLISTMGTVFGNGPAGVFENEDFALGTKKIFSAMADSPGYSVLGGGDTTAALRMLDISGINHVSSGGGALLNLLAGKPAPALEVILKKNSHAQAVPV
jgi:phosphoglycerate kinase